MMSSFSSTRLTRFTWQCTWITLLCACTFVKTLTLYIQSKLFVYCNCSTIIMHVGQVQYMPCTCRIHVSASPTNKLSVCACALPFRTLTRLMGLLHFVHNKKWLNVFISPLELVGTEYRPKADSFFHETHTFHTLQCVCVCHKLCTVEFSSHRQSREVSAPRMAG